jgi:hypothetical protein
MGTILFSMTGNNWLVLYICFQNFISLTIKKYIDVRTELNHVFKEKRVSIQKIEDDMPCKLREN